MKGVKMVYFGEKMVSKWYIEKNSQTNKFFYCNLCLFTTQNKKDFLRHIKTKKHDTKWYMSFGNHECVLKCNDCDWLSCNYDDFKSHNCNFDKEKKPQKNPKKTPKMLLGFSKEEKPNLSLGDVITNNKQQFVCVVCGKCYKYKSGFYRHRKRCIETNGGLNDDLKKCDNLSLCSNSIIGRFNTDETNEFLMKAIIKATETNSMLCERIVALENTVANTNHVVNNNTITNNINKQELNINVFLNQECKNAMNLKDFLKNIQLNLDDLDYTMSNGYIKGITNIFIRNLEEMALNERPIHSIQDNSNHQFYIKDENKWECDEKDEKLDQSIDALTKRQINKIKDWESQHPNWENSENGIEEYMKIVQTIMGGGDEKERQYNKEKIKKELVSCVKLDANIITK